MSTHSLNPPKKLELSLIETVCLLRNLRDRKDAMALDVLALEERIRAGEDGSLKGAHAALSTDVQILTGILAKIWNLWSPTFSPFDPSQPDKPKEPDAPGY